MSRTTLETVTDEKVHSTDTVEELGWENTILPVTPVVSQLVGRDLVYPDSILPLRPQRQPSSRTYKVQSLPDVKPVKES